MNRKSRKLPRKKCPIPACWQEIPISAHMCRPCTSWWNYHQTKNAEELGLYLKRTARTTSRTMRIGWLRRSA